ncbi:hypothetical protein AB0C84_40315 [Actinomadura sp. NPDC048955]|uniref:hypothetical protein n=1 Tax=Actinomadura sp. NPDC048955 TaxID=3158228 RepID=UPI0033ED41A6
MNSANVNRQRVVLAVWGAAVAVLAVALLVGIALAAGEGSGDDRRGAGEQAPVPDREVVAMLTHDEQHALLHVTFRPVTGQVTGTLTLVHFDSAGNQVRSKIAVGGRGSGRTIQLDGLGDHGPITGTLSTQRPILNFDQTFGVNGYAWTVIPTEDVFETKVAEYAERLAACPNKQGDPCAT